MSEAKARELLREVEVYLAGMETRNEHLLARLRRYLAVVPAPAELRVPREPTEKMMLAGNNASPLYDREIRRIWRAMYDAAPAAEPVAQQPPPPDTPHEVLAIIERKVGREMEATAARIAKLLREAGVNPNTGRPTVSDKLREHRLAMEAAEEAAFAPRTGSAAK